MGGNYSIYVVIDKVITMKVHFIAMGFTDEDSQLAEFFMQHIYMLHMHSKLGHPLTLRTGRMTDICRENTFMQIDYQFHL